MFLMSRKIKAMGIKVGAPAPSDPIRPLSAPFSPPHRTPFISTPLLYLTVVPCTPYSLPVSP